MKKAIVICFLLAGLLAVKSNAQTLPVGSPVLDDYYRREQLLGHLDSSLSFTLRPIISTNTVQSNDIFFPEGTSQQTNLTTLGPQYFANGKGVFKLLPLSWQQQINSDHPYGWNDGAMIPAKGYQTMVSGGVFIKYGIISIQLRPEFVYAANPRFTNFSDGHSGSDMLNYYSYHNAIDAPEYFGNGAYTKMFWGQSNIMLNFGHVVAIGLSTENIWWGPGLNNALILSNNAPGFAHMTLNTLKPIKTPIGLFEGQIIGGLLNSSGYNPTTTTSLPDGTQLFFPRENDWRYFTGINIGYQPKPIPGLTLGLIRTFNAYEKDVKGINGYLPFFTPYEKINVNNGAGDSFPRDQYTSLYARWLFPKAQAEFYVEYGLNDNSYNIRDFILSPEHSRAYIVGFCKFVPIKNKKNEHLMISGEIDQLSQADDRIVRDAGGWYQHGGIKDGHTNLGQVLGAGTGSGGNLQTAEISWISGLKKLGVLFQRYEHDMDFYHQYMSDLNGNSRSWVDLAFGFTGEWNYKNFLFNTKIQDVKSLNYEWILKGYTPGMPYYVPNNTVYNLHAELGVTYRF